MAHRAVVNEDKLKEAAQNVNLGLSWGTSVEGADFWVDVFDRLNTYASGGTPRKLGKAAPAAKELAFAEQAQQRITAIKKGTVAAQDAAQTES